MATDGDDTAPAIQATTGGGAGAGGGAGVNYLFFDGTLPAESDGTIATAFNAINTQEHKERAHQLYDFFMDPNSNLMNLNGDRRLLCALVAVPKSKLVKVVYGFGYGTSGIGATSAISKKLLLLFGEGGADIGGSPQVLVLDPTVTEQQAVNSISEATFLQLVQVKGQNYSYPLATASTSTDPPATIMKLAPIPAHLVYDGFGKDLDIVEVYERIHGCDEQTPVLNHAKAFLRSALLNYTVGASKPYTAPEAFMKMASREARAWATERYSALIPMAVAAPAPQGGGDLQQFFLHYMAQQHPAPAVHGEEKKDDGAPIMSTYELRMTLKLCGGDIASGTEDDLPQWFKDVAEKKLTANAKNMIITSAINDSVRYPDAEVPIMPALLKMIRD